jgi:hypothetical protein
MIESGGGKPMSLTAVLQEIGERHHRQIRSIEATAPRGGGRDGAIGGHKLAIARESCEAIADDFIQAHLNKNSAPTDKELQAVGEKMNGVVNACLQAGGTYRILASIAQQFQYVTAGPMYKIRKAFVGFSSKNQIGF